MDLTTTPTPTTTPDTDNDTPPHTQQVKQFSSYANGTVKKHHVPYHLHYFHHHHLHHHQAQQQFVDGVGGGISVSYRECLKNHAASIGGHALDGCGEFMASSTVDPTDPTSLKCAACGCHRNFHRREPHDEYYSTTPLIPHFLDFRHPPPAGGGGGGGGGGDGRSSASPSPSPPPPQPTQSFAPQMLLALSSAAHEDQHQIGLNNVHHQQVVTPVTPTAVKSENLSGRKRFRTKFTQEQKEKMHSFSEKLGWKLQKCDDAMVKDFCNEIGVARGVLKVWMHNNKNTLGKRSEITATVTTTTTTATANNGTPTTIIINNATPTTITSGSMTSFDNNGSSHNMNNNNNNNNNNEAENITNASHYHDNETTDAVHHLHISTNGSSSSS